MHIYFWLLVAVAVSLPLSPYTTSIFQILLGIYWIFGGHYPQKIKRLKQEKGMLWLSSIYILHLIALLWTSDFSLAQNDLRIKLPILLLPLIIGTLPALSKREIIILFSFQAAAILISFGVSLAFYAGVMYEQIDDARKLSRIISHIRLSLLIDVTIFAFVYFISGAYRAVRKIYKISAILLIFLLTSYLILLKSLTGIIVFGILSIVTFLFLVHRFRNKIFQKLSILFLIAAIGSVCGYLYYEYKQFYDIDNIQISELETHTKNGSTYIHDLTYPVVENGNYVNIYLSESELKQEWNKISKIHYDSLDNKKQEIKYTLIRYLTARGLRKDAEGIKYLTETDIKNIENGIANPIYVKAYSPHTIIYTLIWQIDVYLKTGNPSGHSVTQRFEYARNGIEIIKRNFWIGVGTGDLKAEYDNQYNISNSYLSKNHRLRTHNQILTFFIAFGFFGFLWSMSSLIMPIVLHKRRISFLFVIFAIAGFLSTLNEDTLETQAGVTFFIFYYCLLLFGFNENSDLREKLKKSIPYN